MRILVVNWQDRENPQAGGAETHLHEIFGRLARLGNAVTLLCGGWPGCPPSAELDGISVHRVGTRHTFPLMAYEAYRSRFAAERFDVLVEDLNKLPLLTPWWVRGRPAAPRIVGLVHHLFGSTAFRELSSPLAAAVWLGERPLGRVYRLVPFEAVSQSTADDLVARGIPRANVRVIYQGVDTTAHTPDPACRSVTPLFAYLGRLKRYKGVDIVIRAFARMRTPGATLEIAGAGDYRAALEELANSLDLGGRVRFLGRVSEADKLLLLRRAWALTFASPKEGWGITNMEAAACGTPVVASNSPGIRESVRDGQTGFLVPHGNIDAMTAALERLARDPALVAAMGRAGREFAETLTWDHAAAATAAHLAQVALAGVTSPPRLGIREITIGALADMLRDTLQLETLALPGADDAVSLGRELASPEVSSPGLVLAGYVDRFVGRRLQVLGETEVTYLSSLGDAVREGVLARFFSFDIPAIFITKGQELPPGLGAAAAAARVAVFRTPLKTNEFYRRIKPVLEDLFAPATTLHGSLADVFGVGLLFTGKSGIGKSECVLDLVERGHRLVADDLVLVARRGTDLLVGRGHELQRHFMEVRGIGLIDVRAIFGIRAVRQQKRIEVVVHLEEWNQDAVVERTGLDGVTVSILGVPVPKITVPLNPGKNITVVAEVIAMNHLLRYSGVDAAEQFNERLIDHMQRARSQRALVQRYLREDDE